VPGERTPFSDYLHISSFRGSNTEYALVELASFALRCGNSGRRVACQRLLPMAVVVRQELVFILGLEIVAQVEKALFWRVAKRKCEFGSHLLALETWLAAIAA
jgi:hypothetical protein